MYGRSPYGRSRYGAFTLPPSSGSNKTVSAGAGSYALTGTAASVLVKRVVVAGAGSYALTGTAASLNHGWKVAAGAGAYNLTGTDATLTKTSANALAAGAGSYALTGTAATLLHTWKLSAAAGAYSLTGTDAALTKTRAFPAGAGSYALTGTAATLLQVRKLIADSGIYLLSGSAAALTVAQPSSIVETKPYRRGTYRLRSKRPEEITASDVREAAREFRAEVRADPTSEEVDDLIAEFSQAIDSLAHIDRLAKSLADLSSAVEFALAEQADEEEASALLLAH